MSDNDRVVLEKTKKDKGVPKMHAEQAAAKERMEERKRKHEEEEKADIERKKQLVENNSLQTATLAKLTETFAAFVATPPQRAADHRNEHRDDARVDKIEGDVNALRNTMVALQTSQTSLQSSQAQGFAAIMAQLNAMQPKED